MQMHSHLPYMREGEPLVWSVLEAVEETGDEIFLGMIDHGCSSWPIDPKKQIAALAEWDRRFPKGDPWECIPLPNLWREERPCEHEDRWDLPGEATCMDASQLKVGGTNGVMNEETRITRSRNRTVEPSDRQWECDDDDDEIEVEEEEEEIEKYEGRGTMRFRR